MNPTAFLGLILGPAFTGVIIFAPLFCYLYSLLGWNVDEGIELGFKLGIVLPYVFMFLVYAKGRAALETADEAKRRDHAQLMDDLYAAGGRNPIGQLKAIRAYSERRKQREAEIKHPAHSPALAAWQASGDAQAEPKQTEGDSIRALLGARIKEMEAILERLQAERERLANVASDEELDALKMEIRARQKLIHAINQGADDMELHLCIARVEYGEEIRKEFEQMRLSDA